MVFSILMLQLPDIRLGVTSLQGNGDLIYHSGKPSKTPYGQACKTLQNLAKADTFWIFCRNACNFVGRKRPLVTW